ncbi:MAG TPA: hypothetical protein DCL56_12510, partial [Lactobacillus sp.]|nr:hypothetical protein [Lactobacillus sp.]
GSLFHAVLDRYLTQLREEHMTLADVDPSAINAAVPLLVEDIASQPGYEILGSTHRMLYLTRRLSQ